MHSITPRSLILISMSLIWCGACGVDERGRDTGGVPVDASGFVVVNSDYQSASVSLVDLEGRVLSENFISSSSAHAGLSAALSGDVVLPSAGAIDGEIVLIDRAPAGVLTWVDQPTARVRAQLNVSTGFFANPHDYVRFSDTKAYVTRHSANFASGKQEFDAGNDVLIIDPSVPEISGRIDLTPAFEEAPEGYYPTLDRALMLAGKLRVLALGFNRDFSSSVDSRVISIDPERESIEQVLVLEGMHSCTGVSVAPSGHTIAVSCSGMFGQAPESGFPDSGIVLMSVADELTEVGRFGAAELGGEMIAGLSFVNETTLLFTTFGRLSDDQSKMAAPDTARLLDLERGEVVGSPLQQTSRLPFSLGDPCCDPSASVCVLTDAETRGGVLHYYHLDDSGKLESQSDIEVDGMLGLPPRSAGPL